MIDRHKFVKTCAEAIKKTRKTIAVQNQVSGYLKYHKEIKENKLFFSSRKYIARNNIYKKKPSKQQESLLFCYQVIKRTKMGNCGEIAQYLLVELIKKLNKLDVQARIHIVESEIEDHVYIRIEITLKDEKGVSVWEVDAWDPRIIDVSERPDKSKSIKNSEALSKAQGYGEKPEVKETFETGDFKDCQISLPADFEKDLPSPVEGLGDCPTPPHEVISRHPFRFNDCTIEEAIKNKKLPKEDDKLHYLQKPSSWQMKSKT